MNAGAWVLVAAVVLAVAFGGYRLLADGRFRGVRRDPAAQTRTVWDEVADALPQAQPGERATLVQFSSAFCAPCRATRRTLTEVAEVVPGVVHLEVDAEQHLELVRRLEVSRTPTTLILDASGAEASRAAGAPRKEQVLHALTTMWT